MEAWMGWLIAVGVLGIVGVLTAVVEFGMFAVAAVAAAAVAGLGVELLWQLVVFAFVCAGMLLFVRPVVLRHLGAGTGGSGTGVAALRGASAVVLETVDEHGGRIKLAGEVWSARTLDTTRVFEPGERVDVAEIDGATAVVM